MLEASLGVPQQHRHLTLFPIVAEKDRRLPYLLLQEALESGSVTIREVGEGSVPTLEALNESMRPVLILDGEELKGAKQNRITSRSLILEPGSKTLMPVSCVEQGRWRQVSDHFTGNDHHAPSKVRRHARRVESSRVRETGRASHRDLSAAQGAVWDEIRSYEGAAGRHSETGAMNDLYDGFQAQMERWMEAFPPVDRQVGLLAFSGDEVLGMDALGSGEIYLLLHRRLLTGYIMDALCDRGDGGSGPGEEAALAFVDRVRKARRVPSGSVGAGEYRVLRGEVLGGELVEGGHLVHLSAFPGGEEGHRDDPIPGPRMRRKRYI